MESFLFCAARGVSENDKTGQIVVCFCLFANFADTDHLLEMNVL